MHCPVCDERRLVYGSRLEGEYAEDLLEVDLECQACGARLRITYLPTGLEVWEQGEK